MYAIHTTPGFIIESRPRGEAGKLLSIFTRDLGLVLASAQGIRLEKSKLRYHAQEFSLGEFSFVRGKEFWRLTGAGGVQEVGSRNQEFGIRNKELGRAQEIIPRIALLLKRLLRGEEAHPELFEHIRGAVCFLQNEDGVTGSAQARLTDEQLRTLESLIVFRIVHMLGYVGADKGLDVQIIEEPLSIELISKAMVHRMAMNMHINKALRESQL